MYQTQADESPTRQQPAPQQTGSTFNKSAALLLKSQHSFRTAFVQTTSELSGDEVGHVGKMKMQGKN